MILGAMIAVGYELPAGSGTTIVPQLSLRGNLLSPVREGVWRDLTFGASLALLFDLSPAGEQVDSAIRPEVAPAPKLTASIRIDGIDEKGKAARVAGVRVNEIYHRRYSPLLPAIFF